MYRWRSSKASCDSGYRLIPGYLAKKSERKKRSVRRDFVFQLPLQTKSLLTHRKIQQKIAELVACKVKSKEILLVLLLLRANCRSLWGLFIQRVTKLVVWQVNGESAEQWPRPDILNPLPDLQTVEMKESHEAFPHTSYRSNCRQAVESVRESWVPTDTAAGCAYPHCSKD